MTSKNLAASDDYRRWLYELKLRVERATAN